ncbi:MAG TPA: hypothetical protein H9865_09065 [Candidatus Fournierella pullicola]|uniref:Uncharacterized protein n=1 Tax=Candidatus Allofournierella pullicola TaxID=2838596 RepID=A0A9D1V5M1_9FIRM|nr:hypothetical protein [Candidatus Fournierella pullicola]
MDKMIESTKELMEEQMPSFDFLLDEEAERNSLLAEHRAWLKSIKHERPLPKHPFHVAVYIRYFNQTRYENYLYQLFHIHQTIKKSKHFSWDLG